MEEGLEEKTDRRLLHHPFAALTRDMEVSEIRIKKQIQ
jgi:hypothetical protein